MAENKEGFERDRRVKLLKRMMALLATSAAGLLIFLELPKAGSEFSATVFSKPRLSLKSETKLITCPDTITVNPDDPDKMTVMYEVDVEAMNQTDRNIAITNLFLREVEPASILSGKITYTGHSSEPDYSILKRRNDACYVYPENVFPQNIAAGEVRAFRLTYEAEVNRPIESWTTNDCRNNARITLYEQGTFSSYMCDRKTHQGLFLEQLTPQQNPNVKTLTSDLLEVTVISPTSGFLVSGDVYLKEVTYLKPVK